MISHHYIDIDFAQYESIDSDFNWFIIYYFHESINDNKDRVITFAFLVSQNWETCPKIY